MASNFFSVSKSLSSPYTFIGSLFFEMDNAVGLGSKPVIVHPSFWAASRKWPVPQPKSNNLPLFLANSFIHATFCFKVIFLTILYKKLVRLEAEFWWEI